MTTRRFHCTFLYAYNLCFLQQRINGNRIDITNRFTALIEFCLIYFIQIQLYDFSDIQSLLSIFVILICGYSQDDILIIQNRMNQPV